MEEREKKYIELSPCDNGNGINNKQIDGNWINIFKTNLMTFVYIRYISFTSKNLILES